MKKFPSKPAEELITNVYASFVEPGLTYDVQMLQLAQAMPGAESEDALVENAEDDSTTQATDAETEQAEQDQDPDIEEIDAEVLSEGGSPAAGENLSGGGNTVVDNLHDPDTAFVLDEPRDLDINWNSFKLELYVPPILQVDEVVQVQACDVTIIIKFCCQPIYPWSGGKESFSSCGVSSCCSNVFSNGMSMISQWESKGGDYSFFEECCFAESDDDYGGGYGGYGEYFLAEESEYEKDYEDCSDCIEIELNFQDLTTGTFGRFTSGDGPCCFDLGVMVVAAALERAAFVVPQDIPSSNYQGEDSGEKYQESGCEYNGCYGEQGISVHLAVDVCITCFDSITVQGLSGQAYSTLGVSFAMSVSCDPNYNSNGREIDQVLFADNGYGNDYCCFLVEFDFHEFFDNVLSDCCYGNDPWLPVPGPAVFVDDYGSGYSSYSDGKNTNVNLDLHICCSEGYSVGSEGNSIDYVNASTFWVSACINCTESEYGYMQIFDDNTLNALFEDTYSNGGYNKSSDCIECCIDCNWITDWLSSVTESQSNISDNTSLATGFASEIGVAQCLAFDKVAALLEGLLAACCCESEDDYQGECYQNGPTDLVGWGYDDYGNGYELENHSQSSQSVALSMGAENIEIYDQVGTTVIMGEEIETYDYRVSESYATLDLVLCVQCESSEYEIFNPYSDIDDIVAIQEVQLVDDEWEDDKSCVDDCCFDCNWISDLFYDMSEYGLDGNYGQPLGIGFNTAGLFLGKAVENCCCYDGGYEGGYIQTPAREDGFGSYESNDNNSLKMALEFETNNIEEAEVDDGVSYLDAFISIETDLEIALCIECDSYEYGHYGQRPFIGTFDENAYDDTEFDRLHVQGAMLRASLYFSQSTDIDTEASEYIADTGDGKVDYYTDLSISSNQDLDINLELSIKNHLTIKEGEAYNGGGYLSEGAESSYIEESEDDCFDCEFNSINCSLELIDPFAVLGESSEGFDCICVPEINIPECNISSRNLYGPNDFQLTTHDKLDYILRIESSQALYSNFNEEYREAGQLVLTNFNSDSYINDNFEISLCVECETDEIYNSSTVQIPGLNANNGEYADQFANYNYPKGCCFDCDWTSDLAALLAQADTTQENVAFEVIAKVLGDALTCCCESFEESGFNIEVYNQGPYYERAQITEDQLALEIVSTSYSSLNEQLSTSIYEDTYGKKGVLLEEATEYLSEIDAQDLYISLDIRCYSAQEDYVRPNLLFPSFVEDDEYISESYIKGVEEIKGIELSLDIGNSGVYTAFNNISIPNVDMYDMSPTSAYDITTLTNNSTLEIDLCICCESEEVWVIGDSPIILDVIDEPILSVATEDSNAKKADKEANDCCFTCDLADNLTTLLSKENLSNSQNYIQLGVIMVALVADTAVACICEDEPDSISETETLQYGLIDYEHELDKSDIIQLDISHYNLETSLFNRVNSVTPQQTIEPLTESITSGDEIRLDLELQVINTENRIENLEVQDEFTSSDIEVVNFEAAKYEGVQNFTRFLEEVETKSISFKLGLEQVVTFSDIVTDSGITEVDTTLRQINNQVSFDIALNQEHLEYERINLTDLSYESEDNDVGGIPSLYSGFDFGSKYCIDCDSIESVFQNLSLPTNSEDILFPISLNEEFDNSLLNLMVESLCCTFEDSQANLVQINDNVEGTYNLRNSNNVNMGLEFVSVYEFDEDIFTSVDANNNSSSLFVDEEETNIQARDEDLLLATIYSQKVNEAVGGVFDDGEFSHAALNTNNFKAYAKSEKISDMTVGETGFDQAGSNITDEYDLVTKEFQYDVSEIAVAAQSFNTVDHYLGSYQPNSIFSDEELDHCCAFDLLVNSVVDVPEILEANFSVGTSEQVSESFLKFATFILEGDCFDCSEDTPFTNGLLADEYFNTNGNEHYRQEANESLEIFALNINATVDSTTDTNKITTENLNDENVYLETSIDLNELFEISILALKNDCYHRTEANYGEIDELITFSTQDQNALAIDDGAQNGCCIDCDYIEQVIEDFNELETSIIEPCFAYEFGSELYTAVLDTACKECPTPTDELIRGYQTGSTFNYHNVQGNNLKLGIAYSQVASDLDSINVNQSVVNDMVPTTLSDETNIADELNSTGFGIKICVDKFGEQVVSLEYDAPDFYDTFDNGLVTPQISQDYCCDVLEDCVDLSIQLPEFTIGDVNEGFLNEQLSEILADCGCIQVVEIDGSSGGEDVNWMLDPESEPLETPDNFMIVEDNLTVESFYDQQNPNPNLNFFVAAQAAAISSSAVGYSICVICEDALYEPEEDEIEASEAIAFANAALVGEGEEQICCLEEFDFTTYSTQINDFVQSCCEEHVLSVGVWTNDTYGDLVYESNSIDHVATNVSIVRGIDEQVTEQTEIEVDESTLQTLETSNDLTLSIDLSMTCYHSENGYISYMGEDLNGVTTTANGTSYFTLSDYGLGDFVLTSPDMSILDGAFTTQIEEICDCCTDEVLFDPNQDEGNLIAQSRSQVGALVVGASEANANGTFTNDFTGYQRSFTVTHDLSFSASLLVCTECFVSDQWSFNETPESPEDFAVANYPSCCPNIDLGLFEEIIMQTVNTANIENYFLPPDIPYIGENDFGENGVVFENGYAVNGEFWSHTLLDIQMEIEIILNDDGTVAFSVDDGEQILIDAQSLTLEDYEGLNRTFDVNQKYTLEFDLQLEKDSHYTFSESQEAVETHEVALADSNNVDLELISGDTIDFLNAEDTNMNSTLELEDVLTNIAIIDDDVVAEMIDPPNSTNNTVTFQNFAQFMDGTPTVNELQTALENQNINIEFSV